MSFKEYEKAVTRLEEALNTPLTDMVRDSAIQRFEFTVELAWKTSKKVAGLSALTSKQVIREMAQAGLIDDPERWFLYIDARNESSHTYKEELAVKVYGIAKEFLPDAKDLLERLKEQ